MLMQPGETPAAPEARETGEAPVAPPASTASSAHLTRMIDNFESNLPETKLESMGLGMMRAMFGSMWLLGLLSTAAMIMLGAMFSTITAVPTEDSIEVNPTNGLKTGVYALEGVFRTLGSVGVLFLLVSFPQRTVLSALENRHSKLPQTHQFILMAQVILLALSPEFFFYGTVVFWGDFDLLTEEYLVNINDNQTSVEDGKAFVQEDNLPSLMHIFTNSTAWGYNIIILALFSASLFIFPIAWFKSQQREKALVSPVASSSKEMSRHASSSFGGGGGGEDTIRQDDDAEEPGMDTAYEELKMRTKAALSSAMYKVRVRCTEWDFGFVVLCYFLIILLLGYTLQVNTSIVPFVHLITVLRFCIEADVADFVPSNETFSFTNPVVVDGIEVQGNLTVNLVVKSLQISAEFDVCSPNQVDSRLFLRVICLSIACFLELGLAFYIYRTTVQTKMFLLGRNYFRYRKEILEFQFFKALYVLVACFIVLIGILSTSLNPLDVYYLRNLRYEAGDDGRGNSYLTLVIDMDPLYQVGVSFGAVGFGSVFCMMIGFLVWICFTSLPVDSFGFTGWFCARKLDKNEEKNLVLLYSQSDYLALVPDEQTVAELLDLKEREALPPTLRVGLATAFANLTKTRSRSKLQNQIAGNFLCLETEILLFHFMHLSYVLANTKKVMADNPAAGAAKRVPLTEAEKRALVEDTNFSLEAHIIDVESDTHAFVFASQDRIVIAFRGSVSMTNWRTDFDFAEVECPFASQVSSPDISLLGEGNHLRAKKVSEQVRPVVHRGFVLAYDTVRLRVLDQVRALQSDKPTRTAIFVTGHSLGGGLGILCTLDLGVTLKLNPDSLTLTTWGCPKVGNFSFATRFARICPSARRFAMVDDVITKLPPKKFLATLTLGGWWHVGTEILLNSNGQCLIRPTDLERFMFQKTLGNASAHLRMNYATAIMIWIVRSQPDYKPNWWVSVLTLFNKNRDKRLKKVPGNIRQVLMESLQKPGVVYRMDQRTVRDMIATTAQEEEEVGEMITQLLVAYRMGNVEDFEQVFARLQQMREENLIFHQQVVKNAEGMDGDGTETQPNPAALDLSIV